MAEVTIEGGELRVELTGVDKLAALRGHLEVPIAHVRGVRADPEIGRGVLHGIKAPGTNIPGVLTAGTFYSEGERWFWDVHDPAKVVVIDLAEEHFDHLVLGVGDPDAVVRMIQGALAG
ncbi:MAG: hypothetical protein ACRDZQ_00100 [Acidimicrobiales bacterium]